jgi:HEAT repeat protein
MTTEFNNKEKPRSRRFSRWLFGAALVALCFCAMLLVQKPEPTYQGKSVSAWFAEAVEATGNSYWTSTSFKAINAMEGDAVPFLTRQLDAHPTIFARAYAAVFLHLPSGMRKKLSTPRDEGYYAFRRLRALELLAQIGSSQRLNSDAGKPTAKTLASTAVPQLCALLHHTNGGTRRFAAQALWFIGPPSAVAVPDLIKLAADPGEEASLHAVQSFGTIGPAASNAVDVLTNIAMSNRKDRSLAVASLGGIGPVAQSAAPVLAIVLNDTDEKIRVSAARSLAEIGVTPEEAVPALLAMRQSTNEWARTVAAFALWNRNTNDTQLTAELVSFLNSEKGAWLSFSMARLGSGAAPFLPQIKALAASDPDPFIRQQLVASARKIEGIENDPPRNP